MRENGLSYTLTAYSSDGTSLGSVSINPAGWSGSGWFAQDVSFSSGVSASVAVRPQSHGSYLDAGWREGITGSFTLLCMAATAALRQSQQDSLMLVLDAMLGDDGGYGVLSWTPQDSSSDRAVTGLQLVQPPVWSTVGGALKSCSFVVQSERPFAESATATNYDTVALTESGGGFTVPLTIPFSLTASGAGTIDVTNSGSVDAYPTMLLYGPISAPVVTWTATGFTSKQLSFASGSIAAGDYWTIDPLARTVTLNGGTTSMISALDLSSSQWFGFPPGSSSVQLTGSAYTSSTKLRVQMKSAWS